MTVGENLSEFAGKPVVDFLDPWSYGSPKTCEHKPLDKKLLADPGQVAWRLRYSGCCDVRERFMETVDTTKVTHVVTGYDTWVDAEDAPRLTHLETLDLHHHFLSEPMMERIRAALPGVRVDLEGGKDPQTDHRYVAVSE
ncbi:hypothetical protein ACFQ07_11155 [Actinomadura adrarensis]|uniref:Leucine-rich repeat domain-containing protein n=1 Tax=Actinomadura adrarensis TaxID=1819600 RepID=A0ABW3CGB7_9ACTN